MDVRTVCNWEESLPSCAQVYERVTQLVNIVNAYVIELLDWVQYYAKLSFPSALYPNMTRGNWNQLDMFTRPGMKAPGKSACTFIAMAAVKSFLDNREFTEAEINTDLKCGIVAAMRFAHADLPQDNGINLSREEVQRAINELPGNVGRLHQLGSADEASMQFDGLQDLFMYCAANNIQHGDGLGGFFVVARQVPDQKVAAIITRHGRGSHMLGVTKGVDGSLQEIVFFDSHGALRSKGKCFSLRWTVAEDGNPRQKFEEFIRNWYGRDVNALGFTPYGVEG